MSWIDARQEKEAWRQLYGAGLSTSGRAEITADAVAHGFSGNGHQAAREMALPVPVVYRAVRLVAAERDWLISLQAAGVISELQLARLAVLQGLLASSEERHG